MFRSLTLLHGLSNSQIGHAALVVTRADGLFSEGAINLVMASGR
jgi:hypothetical protein